MTLTRFLLAYAVTLPIVLAIDFLWLAIVARSFYQRQLGHLLGASVNWTAAALFYLVFSAGVVFFAVRPALDANSALRALALGAALGFFAYATYDLTNHATMRDWPVAVTVVDLAWGSLLSATVAWVGYQLSTRLS